MKSAFLLVLILVVCIFRVAAEETSAPGARGVPESNALTHPVATMRPVTYVDRYCSGFISKALLPRTAFISGSIYTPHASKLGGGDVVYVTGPGLREGMQFQIVRELRDPNRSEFFKGQHGLMRQAGQPYGELGRLRIMDTRQKMAIAVIEFGCKAAVPGDILIPWVERPDIPVRGPAVVDRFAPANGKLTGRIVMAQDFDSLLGVGQKVYLTIGGMNGVKPGDVFRVYRSPDAELRDEVEALSYKSGGMVEDAQKNPVRIRTGGLSLDPEFFDIGRGPKVQVKDLPRRIIGQIVVLNVTPTSATAMITVALENIHLGDGVEVEDTAIAENQGRQNKAAP